MPATKTKITKYGIFLQFRAYQCNHHIKYN
jgi:hypothetical protein